MKIKKDYAGLFPNLIDRRRFNRRRKRLHSKISQQEHITEKLNHTSNHMIIGCVQVPVIKIAHKKSYRAFKKDFESAPVKGYSAVNKSWFFGYKLHVVICDNAVVQQSGLSKGNVHDINYLKDVKKLPFRKMLLGDRAYIFKPLQASRFDDFKVTLKVPFRSNQHDYQKNPSRYQSKRQMVEAFFAQMCDQMNLKRNYSKSVEVLITRLASKLSAMAKLHWINFLNKRKLSQIKHPLIF